MIAKPVWTRVGNAYRRRVARWFGRQLFTLPAGRAIVSFTFDDFPRSALLTGGKILEAFGFRATYYMSLGLAGQSGPMGPFFRTEDLRSLVDAGHELGCHTFDHCPAWETAPGLFEASVVRNRAALFSVLPGTKFGTLSYPINYPQPETKNRVSRYFACCRGGGQTFNGGSVDLNYLASFFLEQAAGSLDSVQQALRDTIDAGGWLIFSTHDVSEMPSRYGITPTFFRRVVEAVTAHRAEVLPVHVACHELHARAALSA